MDTNQKDQNMDKMQPESEDQASKEIDTSPPDLVEQHRKELDRLKQESDNNYNLYLRTLADAENGRKRLLKEVENSKRFAMEGFLKEILPVLDGFEKALAVDSLPEMSSSSFLEGISIVRKQLVDLLEKNGLQGISSEGKKFDPNIHQAIKRTESQDVSEETVECEYAKAYKIYDKLLRPAIVSVLVPAKVENNE